MRLASVDAIDADELTPDDEVWETVDDEAVTLTPVPLNAIDTSTYIRDALSEDDIGAVEEVRASCIHDGTTVAIRLSWEDASRDTVIEDTDEYVDKAAVAFPIEPGASIMTMGSERAPINAWYWRADRTQPYDVIGRGFARTERRDPGQSGLQSTAQYSEDTWSVVFTRTMGADGDEFADLADLPTGISFAVWEGSNRERGPLKAYSGEFKRLREV